MITEINVYRKIEGYLLASKKPAAMVKGEGYENLGGDGLDT
jgi:hypothetical protein